MKENVIIINRTSSGSCNIDDKKLKTLFDGRIIFYDGGELKIPPSKRLVACGGDGTLNHLINDYEADEKIYIPCGTFNETAKYIVKHGGNSIENVGIANDKKFSYVLASGTFTPLGYSVNNRTKKNLKIFAYVFHIFEEYKINRIPAVIKADGKRDEGNYTLIMLSNSTRCFGFNFNKIHRNGDGKLQLLTIKSPRHNGIVGYIEMFFPFFRSFFIGFRREHEGKIITFKNISSADLTILSTLPFCADGDKWELSDTIKTAAIKCEPPIKIITKKQLDSIALSSTQNTE